jgi:tripartite-type tricarboxylate transporter receptor subunit TctC
MRRVAVLVVTLAAALWTLAGQAMAQNYPTRPVRMIVGFAAGGPTDILARAMAQWLSERLGQQFVVENKPGGGGNIATEFALRSDPDGYTILVTATSNAINTSYYSKLSFNFIQDAAPVAGLGRVPYIVEITPSLPAKNLAEFIEYARANPSKVNMASGGSGTSNHLAAELFKVATGLKIVHVPYRGNALAITDLIGGQVQMMFGDTTSTLTYVKAGKLRALAVSTAQRLPELPDVPTLSETLPGFEAAAWYGFAVPKGTPAAIVEKLNTAINAGLKDDKMKERLATLGATPLVFTPAQFGAFWVTEAERWGKAVKAAGVHAD